MASLGECLVELNGPAFGNLCQTFGGDTLNMALYLARVTAREVDVKYVSAVGTDDLSHEMVRRWESEGVDTSLVLRDSTRHPGLYWIQLDRAGERTFLYWRSESAARFVLQHPRFEAVEAELAKADLIYLSAISLAILPSSDRTRLLDLLLRLAAGGVAVAFDSNYRPALWPSQEAARAAVAAILPAVRLMFVTLDDERALWGDPTPEAALARLANEERSVVVKVGKAGCFYGDGKVAIEVPTPPVLNVTDTTAAGDAFNAAFLAGWLAGHTPWESCSAGNSLAGVVIQHRGAIIPASATPELSQLLSTGR